MKILLRLLTAILGFGLTIACANAEKRMALVIGNDLYPNLPASQQLHKGVNDANAVGDALETIGFEVIRGENLSRAEMVANIVKLSGRFGRGDAVFFFYAGHGVTSQGENYLLPSSVPAAMTSEDESAEHQALSEAQILSDLKASGAELAILVVDACRKNPFARSAGGSLGDYACDPSRPAVKSTGVFTLYSASMGQEALDRLGAEDSHPNSVFVRRLAPALKRQGRDLVEIAREVGGGFVALAQSGGLGEMAQEVGGEVAALAQSAGHVQKPAYHDQVSAGLVHRAGEPASPEIRAAHIGRSEPAIRAPDVGNPAPQITLAPYIERSEPEIQARDVGRPAAQITLAPYLLSLPYFGRFEPEGRELHVRRRIPRNILAPHVRRSEAEIRALSALRQQLAAPSSRKAKPAASSAGKQKPGTSSGRKRKPAASSARKGKPAASSTRKRKLAAPAARKRKRAA
jgi:Caspase domain